MTDTPTPEYRTFRDPIDLYAAQKDNKWCNFPTSQFVSWEDHNSSGSKGYFDHKDMWYDSVACRWRFKGHALALEKAECQRELKKKSEELIKLKRKATSWFFFWWAFLGWPFVVIAIFDPQLIYLTLFGLLLAAGFASDTEASDQYSMASFSVELTKRKLRNLEDDERVQKIFEKGSNQ